MPFTRRETPASIWLALCVVLLLLAAAATTLRLTNEAYWLDEIYTVLFSGGGPGTKISIGETFVQLAYDVWTPLYHLLIIGWAGVMGWSEFSLRVLSLFIGLIGIAFVYRLGCEAKSPRTGILFALLAVTSPFYLNYFSEARAYTLYFTLTTASLWLYWRIPSLQKMTRLYGFVFVLTLAALFYTHYVGLATGGALGIYHLLFARKDPRWRLHWNKTLFLLLLSLAAFSPWLLIAIISTLRESAEARGMDAPDVIYWSLYGFSNGLLPYGIVMLGLSIWRLRGRVVNFAWVVLIITLLIALAVNLYADFLFHIRHIIGILPPFLLLIALVLDMLWVRIRWAAILMLVIWSAAGLYGLITPDFINGLPGQVEKLPRSFVMNAVNTLKSCADPADVAVFAIASPEEEWLNDRVLQYYLYEISIPIAQVNRMTRMVNEIGLEAANTQADTVVHADYNQRVQAFVGSARRIWFFELEPNVSSEQFTSAVDTLAGIQVFKNQTGC